MIDPDIYLRALVNDFLAAGGKMKEMAFETEGDLEKLPEPSIVNCMGLGSGKVFGDEKHHSGTWSAELSAASERH
jgi:hypothetical protein